MSVLGNTHTERQFIHTHTDNTDSNTYSIADCHLGTERAVQWFAPFTYKSMSIIYVSIDFRSVDDHLLSCVRRSYFAVSNISFVMICIKLLFYPSVNCAGGLVHQGRGIQPL